MVPCKISCKKCIHYEVCKMHYRQKCELLYDSPKEIERAIKKADKGCRSCEYFKDRSKIKEEV